jgi:hypothetical protein
MFILVDPIARFKTRFRNGASDSRRASDSRSEMRGKLGKQPHIKGQNGVDAQH